MELPGDIFRKGRVVSVDTSGDCPSVDVEMDDETGEDPISVIIEGGGTPEVGDLIGIRKPGMRGGGHGRWATWEFAAAKTILYTIAAVQADVPLLLDVPGLWAGTLRGWKVTGPGKAATFALQVGGVTVDTQTGDGTWKTTTLAITADSTLTAAVTAANAQTGAAIVYFRIN